MNTATDIFNKNGALLIKDVVPKDLCKFLTHVLLRCPDSGYGNIGDAQVPDSVVISHDIYFETLLENVWPYLEQIVGEELLPTYAYSRLYKNNNVLEVHKDRPACEISMTVQLGRSHHYAWPIFMGAHRFDLAEGDGVLYKGCDIEHWRNTCDGPEGYYSGQVFLHFVRKNGPYASEAADASKRTFNVYPFKKHRAHLMESK